MIHLFGDGLAGTFLARALSAEKISYRHYGDGRHNTPPVGFVHLFQGRTFHRDPVEVEAFGHAVAFWRGRAAAQEWTVKRSVTEGDRLHRSAGTESVPPEWRPTLQSPLQFVYQPGFTVASGALREQWQRKSEAPLEPRCDPHSVSGTKVFAVGRDVARLLPEWRWDINPGRTVGGHCPGHPERVPDYLYLHQGLHLGGNPGSGGFTMGGRVNSKGEAKEDEKELAVSLLGEPVALRSEWWGERIANALDRRPLIGWRASGEFYFTGFGGRALFWLPYCTSLAVKALRAGNNSVVPELLRPDRRL